MVSIKRQADVQPPSRPRLQFSLRTLLLLFVVLGASLAVFGAWGVAIFFLAVGLAIYVRHVKSVSLLVQHTMAALGLLLVIALLWPAVASERVAGRRASCQNKMRQIAAALHRYHDANGCFPPAYVADKNGKPMHSWRVLILPYMDWDNLYKDYDFSEPWDGPKNKKFSDVPMKEYICPSEPNVQMPSGAAQTSYLAVVGKNAAWLGDKSRKLDPANFPGGEAKTIMLVEVANSGIAWTEPRDLSLDALETADATLTGVTVSSNHGGRDETFFFTECKRSGANVALADGSIRYLPPGKLSTDKLRKMLQVGGFVEESLLENIADFLYGLRWPNVAALAVWLLLVGMLLRHAGQSRKTLSVSLWKNGVRPPLVVVTYCTILS